MKRVLSFFMALALVGTMVILPSVSAEGSIIKVYGANFKHAAADGSNVAVLPTSPLLDGEQIYNNNSDRLKMVNNNIPSWSAGRVARLNNKTTGCAYLPMSKQLPATGGSSDLYVNLEFNHVCGGNSYHVILGDNAALTAKPTQQIGFAPYAYVDIKLNTNGYLEYATGYTGKLNSSMQTTPLPKATYENKTWNNLGIVVHTAKATYDLYFNGEKVLTDAAYIEDKTDGSDTTVVQNRSAIGSIFIANQAGNSATAGSGTLDFTNVYAYEATGGAEVVNFGHYQAEINRLENEVEIAKNTGAMDDANYTECQETLTACKEQYKADLGDATAAAEDFKTIDEYLALIQDVLDGMEDSTPEGGLKYEKSDYSAENDFYDSTYGIGTHFVNGYNPGIARRETVVFNQTNITAGNGLQVSPTDFTGASGTVYNGAHEGPNARMIVEFDMMLHGLRETGQKLHLMLDASEKQASGRANGAFNVILNGENGLIYQTNGTQYSTTYTTPLEDARWYRVRIEIAATDETGKCESTEAMWQWMYIDGQPVFEKVRTVNNNVTGFGEINTFKLIKDAFADAPTVYGPRILLDNVTAYKANAKAAVTVSRGALIAGIRDAEYTANTSKSYTEATLNGLKAEIAAAKTVAENETATQSETDAAAKRLSDYIAAMTPDAAEYQSLSGLVYETPEGKPAYEPMAGGKLTGVSLNKYAEGTATEVLIGEYEEERLLAVHRASVSTDAKIGEQVTVPLSTPIVLDAVSANHTFRAFLWQAGTLTPVSKAQEQSGKTDKEGVTLFLIGDSTVCDYDLEVNNNGQNMYPRKGWGQMLSAYFDERITIDNRAVSGASTKSFLNRYWNDVIADVKAGDYVFIQFGHNDQKQSPSLYANARVEYKQNLTTYIRQIKEKGANPILVTPVARALSTEGAFVGYIGHREYPLAMKEAAAENHVPVIDLLKLQCDWATGEGFSEIRNDMWLILETEDARYSDDPEFADSIYRNGVKDTTHFSMYGADMLAGLIANELKEMGHPLAAYEKEHTPVKK